jgi:UDP-N-acetylmuramate: L-alanyl-gamma-D-glutamyl-meso-diaminopimelate ligase
MRSRAAIPELEEVLNRKITLPLAGGDRQGRIHPRPAFAGVAGTHGKTTTTSIATWVCEVGGLDPSFLVGGVVQNFGASFRVTDSDHFVIEGDEYDTAYFDKKPKFMHYLPEIAIVNNIEFDHADIYRRPRGDQVGIFAADESRPRQRPADLRGSIRRRS